MASTRNDLRAVRPSGSRLPSALPTVGRAGAAQALGPTAQQIGQPVIARSEGEDGQAIVTVRYESALIGSVRSGDLASFRALAQTMKTVAISMSKGPYSLKQLAAMGHPYAKNKTVVKPKPTSTKSHNVPRFAPSKAIGHIKGIRGSVPTLAVVNEQSGHFADSWSAEIIHDAGGVTVKLENSAEYAAFLLFGTGKMLAHGPFEYAQRLFLPRFNAEWARVITIAWQRQNKGKAAKTALKGVK